MKTKNLMIQKIGLILLAIPLLLNSCTDIKNPNQAEANTVTNTTPKTIFKNLTPQQFQEKIKFGGIILDVRTPTETARGSIKNASFINVNDPNFLQKINLIQKEQALFVYCASGNRSNHASKLMIQNGFNEVYNLTGGIRAWLQAGYPVHKLKINSTESPSQISLIEFQKTISTKTPVLIDFHTAWCAPCKKMSPIIDQLKTDYSKKVGIHKIDVDQNTIVANKYHVRGVPVFILFKEGKEIWRHSGVIESNEIHKILDQHLQN